MAFGYVVISSTALQGPGCTAGEVEAKLAQVQGAGAGEARSRAGGERCSSVTGNVAGAAARAAET